MFNFSANHLLLLSRTEYRTCVVFLMQDHSTHRVYRPYDFTKSQQITPDQYYCVSGKVNSADKLVPGPRVGQDGHQILPVFYNSCSCGRRGRIANEVKNYVAGNKLEFKTACSYAAVGAWVCSELAAALSGPPTNRRKWIPFKLALTAKRTN
jgi:hypothetical protein